MAEEKNKGIFKKLYTSVGIVALVGIIHTSGIVREKFENNSKVCKEDVPKIKEAIITTSVDMAYVKDSQERVNDKLDSLDRSVKELLSISEQNQSLARSLEEPKITTACTAQINNGKNL